MFAHDGRIPSVLGLPPRHDAAIGLSPEIRDSKAIAIVTTRRKQRRPDICEAFGEGFNPVHREGDGCLPYFFLIKGSDENDSLPAIRQRHGEIGSWGTADRVQLSAMLRFARCGRK